MEKIGNKVRVSGATWFPIFSIAYFYNDSETDKDHTTFQSKAMIGIAVVRSNKTNALSFYNPITNQYYNTDTYKSDPYRLPCTDFPSQIHYDGGLHADLYRHIHKNTPDPYPPSIPLKIPSNKDNNNNYTTATVSSIPIRDLPGNTVTCKYLLHLHDVYTFTKTLTKMDAIADSPINKTRFAPNPYLLVINSLPAWLQHGCKVTYDHSGEFHKGFIMIGCDGAACFSCWRQRSSKAE